jgi:hypothetical protein
MSQPEGFLVPGRELVCRLIKSLYNLKQAPRAGTKDWTISWSNLVLLGVLRIRVFTNIIKGKNLLSGLFLLMMV